MILCKKPSGLSGYMNCVCNVQFKNLCAIHQYVFMSCLFLISKLKSALDHIYVRQYTQIQLAFGAVIY